MKRLLPIKTERGIALLGSVFLIVVIGFFGVMIVSLVGTQSFTALNEVSSTNSFYVAEAGIEQAMYQFWRGTSCAGLTNAVPTALGTGSFTTTGTLFRPPSTTLTAGINNNVTTIPVASTAGYAPHGRIRIEQEYIDYSGITAASFTGARRGAGGSAAAAHANNLPMAQSQCLIRSVGTMGGALGNSQRIVERAVPLGVSVQTNAAPVVLNINGTVTVNLPTAVDPARAFLIFNARSNSNRPTGSFVRGRIATPTTLEFVRVTNEGAGMPPINIQWYVVEYTTGVSVQRGQLSQNNATNNVAIPTPLGAVNRAFVTWSKTPTNTDVDYAENDPILGEITSVNNVQFRSQQAAATHTIWWQVVELTSPGAINVQDGTTTLVGGGGVSLSRTITPPTAVNPANTFVLVGFRTSGGGADVGARMLRAQLDGAGNIIIDRNISGSPDNITEIHWQAVSLLDGSVVQGGTENFPAGDAQETMALATTVDPARSVAFASVQPVAGQSMGRTPYNGDDVIGVGSVTMTISAAGNQLTMDRNNTASSTDIGWFVVQFANGSQAASQRPIDWVEPVL